MRNLLSMVGTALVLTVGSAIGQQESTWVALVVAVRGTPQVHRGAQNVPVHALTRLTVGDHLLVPAGGELTIAFLKGGERFTVRHDTVLEADGVSDKTATHTAPQHYAATLMPSGANLDRLGGISSQHAGGGGTPPVVATNDTREPRKSHPTVSAQPGPPSLPSAPAPGAPPPFGSSAGIPQVAPPLLGYTLTAPQLPLPGIDPTRAVTVRVNNSTATEAHSQGTLLSSGPYMRPGPDSTIKIDQRGHTFTYVVHHLTSEEGQKLTSARQEAVASYQRNPADVTPFALMTSLYEDYGCYDEAVAVLNDLSVQIPAHKDYLQALRAGIQNDLSQAVERAGR